jgi:DNA recombination protein RmuC
MTSMLLIILTLAVMILLCLTAHHRAESRSWQTQLFTAHAEIQDGRRFKETFASIRGRGELGQGLLVETAVGCGLREGIHFQTQVKLASGSIPDLVLSLDIGKIPVDAKCPVESYWKGIESADSSRGRREFSALARRILAHATDLSSKNYVAGADGIGGTVLFVPIDAIAITALDADADLFAKLRRLNIYLVGPTGFVILAHAARLASSNGELIKSIEDSKGNARLAYQAASQMLDRLRVANSHMVNLSKTLDQVARHAGNIRGPVSSLGLVGGLIGALKEAPQIEVISDISAVTEESFLPNHEL